MALNSSEVTEKGALCTLPFDGHDLGREFPDLNDLLHLDLGLFLSPEEPGGQFNGSLKINQKWMKPLPWPRAQVRWGARGVARGNDHRLKSGPD